MRRYQAKTDSNSKYTISEADRQALTWTMMALGLVGAVVSAVGIVALMMMALERTGYQ